MSKKVIDLREGEHIEIPLLVVSLNKGITNTGSPYLIINLQDNSKSIEGRMWDVKDEMNQLVHVGKVYSFEMDIIKYRGNLQAKIIRILPIPDSEVNKDDFVSTSPISQDENREIIHSAINAMTNTNIAKIVTATLKYYENDFYIYPAASKIHHEFVGGLATHVSGMLRLAKAICDIYPLANRDYVYAGVILHDLGKIEELSSGVLTEYTTEGKLLGHISIIAARLLEIGTSLGLQDSQELLLLRHMVLSHHGQLEFGSPVKPETVEAELLNFIDNIDARMNVLGKYLAEVNVGEFTSKIFALENRSFFKHQ